MHTTRHWPGPHPGRHPHRRPPFPPTPPTPPRPPGFEGPGAPFGDFGPRGGFGPGFRGRGRHRGRGARRGDVRAAVLALLAERPMHGYEIIQQIEERSGGVWRPSPGSIYPSLQLLADEGLVTGDETGGRRLFTLTDAGREEAARHEGDSPFHQERDEAFEVAHRFRDELGQLGDGGLAGRPGRHRGAAHRDPRGARRGPPPGLPAARRRHPDPAGAPGRAGAARPAGRVTAAALGPADRQLRRDRQVAPERRAGTTRPIAPRTVQSAGPARERPR